MYKINYLISEVVKEVANELGLSVIIEPQYQFVGQITTRDGRKKYFRKNNFDLNHLAASEVARDKGYTSFFLSKMGYVVPQSNTFFSPRFAQAIKSDQTIDKAKEYATSIGYPVIVKPNTRSQGIGVEKVYTAEQLEGAIDAIFTDLRDRICIVEEFIQGNDYRIVVLDNEVISAYQRIPLKVVGDGCSTIQQLLVQKQEFFNTTNRETHIKFDDLRIQHRLHSIYNMAMQSIPSTDEVIYLIDAANLSVGGEAIDFINTIHSSFIDLAVKVASDMGLRLCGVDIIVNGSLAEPIAQNYKIIEVNAAPDLDHYIYIGEQQMAVVKAMYKKVILAMTK